MSNVGAIECPGLVLFFNAHKFINFFFCEKFFKEVSRVHSYKGILQLCLLHLIRIGLIIIQQHQWSILVWVRTLLDLAYFIHHYKYSTLI